MKRQPGLDVAEGLSVLQKNLNSKTRKMKELAGQINMYQAKVIKNIFRQINSNMTSSALKNRSNKSAVNTTNRKRESKLINKTKRSSNKYEPMIVTFYK